MHAPQDTSTYRAEIRATGGLAAWTLAWVGSLALARFGPELWGEGRPAATWAAVVANLVVGVLWIVAYTRFLRAIDELQRKIQQDALAVTLGAGWIAGFGYVAADAAGLVQAEINVAALPVLMSVVFLVAIAVGQIRYR
ncbi:hypothetical protein [Cellulomonas sp. Root137]|uniref:hypothetical protein n=1 Tax=Cellulomonas sp. Root137 TaxID=1736459 RepID=UPI0006F51877|nr:hypothetical protein [Cellulomonas sp. Root137]KQY41965.1 hypothetical protein ASD18_20270 [Cellulomonas sp. Root137]KRD41211.1 hypothetical protein ASE38_16435 [Cellulomonas sp. Root930]